MRILATIVLLLVVAAGVWFYFETQDQGAHIPDMNMSEPTNFNEVGVLRFPPVTSGQSQGKFEYDGGAGTTTLAIEMDTLSVCAAENGATPCVAMSITFDQVFDGRAALIEGTREGNTILVRKMRITRAGEELRSFEPGDTFISWYHAMELLKNCEVKMAMQTHALDVYLTLKDGRRVRAVEPTIDEMFRVINATRGACGTFPVATE
ncbi:MAG TPA: hypothetical protein VNM40_02170 [Candidatus Paceibacterota bacterium]|nr:hypothetical protein [Candidatus Paceibacterota bacterium]